MSDASGGEVIDKMPIEEIINHSQFYSLSIFKGLGNSPDYWEITFESDKRDEQGRWLSFYNQPMPHKHFKVFKLKP